MLTYWAFPVLATGVGVLRVSEVCGASFEKRISKGTRIALAERTKRARERDKSGMKERTTKERWWYLANV